MKTELPKRSLKRLSTNEFNALKAQLLCMCRGLEDKDGGICLTVEGAIQQDGLPPLHIKWEEKE